MFERQIPGLLLAIRKNFYASVFAVFSVFIKFENTKNKILLIVFTY
jgi:hypothetical protein